MATGDLVYIQRSISKITSRILSRELKELEMNTIITRKTVDDSPVLAEYEVAEYCRSFEPIVSKMIK